MTTRVYFCLFVVFLTTHEGGTRAAQSLTEEEIVIIEALKHFKLTNPHIIQHDNGDLQEGANIFKNLFKKGQSGTVSMIDKGHGGPSTKPTINGLCSRLLLLKDNNRSSSSIADHFISICPTLVFASIEVIEWMASYIHIQLNQEVYFLESSSFKVFEAYEVNDIKTFRQLGIFSSNNSNKFHPEEDVEQYFIKRRSDFKGVVIKAMTEIEEPLLWFQDNFKSEAPYFRDNQTYDVTGLVEGMFFEVLTTLESELNFKTRLYKREDGIWGSGYLQEDGTYTTSGMISDLVNGSADMIVASLGIRHPRNLFVDYLPPITYDTGALYIQSTHDTTDFSTYFEPFSIVLWILIIVMASLITAMIYSIIVTLEVKNQFTVCQITSRFWTCLMANFGGKPGPSKLDSKQSYRLIIVISLLTGSVIWISYRAFLTSKLSVAKKVLPFNDMESLANTNYR
jgi:hypothetical protein